jgi:hypothetical protein
VSPGGRLECPRLLLRGVQPCQLVAFSPDSRLLLTSSLDNVVRLHEVASARLLRQFPQGAAAVAVSWFPCSTRFLVASHKALAVYGVGQAGASPQQRVAPAHAFVYDAVVGPGGGCLVSVGQDRQLAFTRLADQRVALVPESGTVTSLHLSSCQRFLTTNLADSCVHLWHLPPGLAAMGGAGTAGVRGGGVAASIACASAMQGQGRGGDPFDALPTAPAMEFRMGQGRRVVAAGGGGVHAAPAQRLLQHPCAGFAPSLQAQPVCAAQLRGRRHQRLCGLRRRGLPAAHLASRQRRAIGLPVGPCRLHQRCRMAP